MRKCVLVAGMPCAGKSIVREVASSLGFKVITMGDVVRGEARRRGIVITSSSLLKLAMELREGGRDVIARKVVELIGSEPGHYLIDGVRSLEEVRSFRECFDRAWILAIVASPRTRFERLMARDREGDPKDWREFEERDMAELKLGLGEVIALADMVVVNDGRDRVEVESEVRRALEGIMEVED